MSSTTTCFRCGSVHTSSEKNLPKLHRQMKAHDMKVIRAERARIRKALKSEMKDAKSLTPGEGTNEDPWIGAVSCMYHGALRVVRR